MTVDVKCKRKVMLVSVVPGPLAAGRWAAPAAGALQGPEQGGTASLNRGVTEGGVVYIGDLKGMRPKLLKKFNY